eukprot:6129436-Amphidinium_carterae.1
MFAPVTPPSAARAAGSLGTPPTPGSAPLAGSPAGRVGRRAPAAASPQAGAPAGPVPFEHLTLTEIPVSIAEAAGVYTDRTLKLHFVQSRNIYRWQTTSRPRYTSCDRVLPSAALQMW